MPTKKAIDGIEAGDTVTIVAKVSLVSKDGSGSDDPDSALWVSSDGAG